jgi:hypothetical protein
MDMNKILDWAEAKTKANNEAWEKLSDERKNKLTVIRQCSALILREFKIREMKFNDERGRLALERLANAPIKELHPRDDDPSLKWLYEWVKDLDAKKLLPERFPHRDILPKMLARNSTSAQPKEPEELPLIFFDEARNAPVQRYHIKGFLAEGATSSVFAKPKMMKSTIVTDAGVHLAAGKEDWRGHRIREAKGVVYFAFERHIQARQALAAYAIRDGLENLPFAIVPRLVNMLDPACVELIKNAIDRVQQRYGIEVALSIFDT